jgi:hypothetical protein
LVKFLASHEVASVGITERTAYSIVTDLTATGDIVERKTVAVTATRSRHPCRCPSPLARNDCPHGCWSQRREEIW